MSMSSLQERVPQTAVRLRVGSFVFAVEKMITPLIRRIGDDHRARRAAQLRRRTEIELSSLPQYLRDDIGFDAFTHQKP